MLWQSDNTPQNVAGTVVSAAYVACESTGARDVGMARQGRGGAPLETTAKSVGQISRQARARADRFRWQRHAAGLLQGQHRVGLCRWSVVSKAAGVDMVSSAYGDGKVRVHYEGTQTCGSVWACPCCSARISETRREEMSKLLAWARAQGYAVRMVTLTCRHGRDDDLADLLLRMKGRSKSKKKGVEAYRGAKQRMADDRRFKDHIRPHLIGSVTATEVTGGGMHGWHPHMHMILILDRDIDLTPMRDAWLGSLRGVGLEGSGQGWDARAADQTGEYIAKWGAAEELTLNRHKRGARSGRTPAQLLADACDQKDARAGHLWAEYARVFHGRRQLVWSTGLKGRVGLEDVKDEDAARDERQDEQEETGRATIPHPVWTGSVASERADRRGTILDRAEEVGVEQTVAELIDGYAPEAEDEVIESDTGGRARHAFIDTCLAELEAIEAGGKLRRGAQGPRQVARPSSGPGGQGEAAQAPEWGPEVRTCRAERRDVACQHSSRPYCVSVFQESGGL